MTPLECSSANNFRNNNHFTRCHQGLPSLCIKWGIISISWFWRLNEKASLVAQMVKDPPAMKVTQIQSLGWEDSLEKGMETHSSILAWKSYGQRSLVGYGPWGCKEWDTTEWLTLPSFLTKVFKCLAWYLGQELLLLFSCWVVFHSVWPPWTIALQAPLSMGFSSQEYPSGLPFPHFLL